MYFTLLQRLRSPLLLSQTVVVYSFYAINVFVFCWFGSELSDQASVQQYKVMYIDSALNYLLFIIYIYTRLRDIYTIA
jgi:hypothetical protein